MCGSPVTCCKTRRRSSLRQNISRQDKLGGRKIWPRISLAWDTVRSRMQMPSANLPSRKTPSISGLRNFPISQGIMLWRSNSGEKKLDPSNPLAEAENWQQRQPHQNTFSILYTSQALRWGGLIIQLYLKLMMLPL